MKSILLITGAAFLVGCASHEKKSADPWQPALPATPKLEIRVFQASTEYPPFPQEEIDALLSDRSRFARNGNPLEEQVTIQDLRKHGVSFEAVPQSFLWIPYPLTQPSGWPTRRRALIIVRQTPQNLEKIDKIFSAREEERQKYIQNGK